MVDAWPAQPAAQEWVVNARLKPPDTSDSEGAGLFAQRRAAQLRRRRARRIPEVSQGDAVAGRENRAMVPVNLRPQPSPRLGDHFGLAPLVLPWKEE